MVLSALVAGGVLVGNRVVPRIPLSLVAVVGTITASALFHFAEKGIPVIGPVPGWAAVAGVTRRDLERSAGRSCRSRLSCFAMIIAQSAATVGRLRAALSRERR